MESVWFWMAALFVATLALLGFEVWLWCMIGQQARRIDAIQKSDRGAILERVNAITRQTLEDYLGVPRP